MYYILTNEIGFTQWFRLLIYVSIFYAFVGIALDSLSASCPKCGEYGNFTDVRANIVRTTEEEVDSYTRTYPSSILVRRSVGIRTVECNVCDERYFIRYQFIKKLRWIR